MAGELIKQVPLNISIFQGRLTVQPELKHLPSGAAVLELRVAINRRYKPQGSDEWKDHTAYVNVTVWNESAERLAERLHKGSPVQVTGEIDSRQWEKDGKRFSVVFVRAQRVHDMERHPDSGEATHEQRQEQGESPAEEPAGGGGGGDPVDNIPFI